MVVEVTLAGRLRVGKIQRVEEDRIQPGLSIISFISRNTPAPTWACTSPLMARKWGAVLALVAGSNKWADSWASVVWRGTCLKGGGGSSQEGRSGQEGSRALDGVWV